ncbi:unnamed protein product, partial [marine sediment metagenome]
MKKKNKYLIYFSLIFSAFLVSSLLPSFDFTSNSIVIGDEINISDYQSDDSGSNDDFSESTSNPSMEFPKSSPTPSEFSECYSNSSDGYANCTLGCFTIVPVDGDYISFKKSSNSLFNDLFNFANDSGFTQCIAKYLVYKKNTSEFIGFMGLRVNEDFTDKIALISFENRSLDTVLVQFSISSENITTFTAFDRSSGIEMSDRTVISSYGAFESLDDIDLEDILLIDDLVGFLHFRFITVKREFDGLEMISNVSLNED